MSRTVLKGLRYFRQLSRLAQLKPSLGADISVARVSEVQCCAIRQDRRCVVCWTTLILATWENVMFVQFVQVDFFCLVSSPRGTCHYMPLLSACRGVLPALCLMLATLLIVEWYMAALGTHGLTRTATYFAGEYQFGNVSTLYLVPTLNIAWVLRHTHTHLHELSLANILLFPSLSNELHQIGMQLQSWIGRPDCHGANGLLQEWFVIPGNGSVWLSDVWMLRSR